MAASTKADTRMAASFSTLTPRSKWGHSTSAARFRQRFGNSGWSQRGDQFGGARGVVRVGGRRDEDDLVGAGGRDGVEAFPYVGGGCRAAHARQGARRVVAEDAEVLVRVVGDAFGGI